MCNDSFEALRTLLRAHGKLTSSTFSISVLVKRLGNPLRKVIILELVGVFCE